jgi:hypothetical protein
MVSGDSEHSNTRGIISMAVKRKISMWALWTGVYKKRYAATP